MCNYSDYVWEKGIAQGLEEGRQEGREEGENRLASLLMKMNAAGETEQVLVVLNDTKVREEFYKKYGL